MALDQFYTKEKYARLCYDALLEHLGEMRDHMHFIEPSAGDGAFYDLLPRNRRVGVDLDPKRGGLMKRDFFLWSPRGGRNASRVVVGNPPFGKRGNVAVDFLRKATEIADTVAFIVPMCFRKHAIHKKLPKDLKLAKQMRLPKDAFRLADGKPFDVNTIFQIWTRANVERDLRQTNPLPIRHPDFLMRQYNNTKEALKVFDSPFSFAVPCQGWQNYARRETRAEACEKSKQWMLLQASGKALDRLLAFDYERLARDTGTSVPGFRKGDLVQSYTEIYG